MRKKTVIMSVIITFLFVSLCFALDSPENLRIATETDNQDQGTVTDPYFDQNFEIARGVSRNSGVAPLSVHFTAGFNHSSATDRGFHNYEYTWNFGDAASGNWGTNGKSKNMAKGPVAAHVYETPGTYTAKLSIRNKSGVVDTDTFTITVSDPDVVFSGSNTTCISDTANNDFSGCPTGATRVATDDISLIANYIGPGRRVLLQRGASWTSNGVNMPNVAGPVSIGAYGLGVNPDSLGIYSNAPTVNLTDGNFVNLSNKRDWRVTDIAFSGTSGGVFGGGIDFQQILVSKIKADGFGVPFGATHWKEYPDDIIDHIMLVSSEISNAGNNCIYIGSERLALLGNRIYNASDSHVVRVWQAYLGIISNNHISGSSLNSTSGRHALKFHGPKENEVNPSGTGVVLNHRSRFTIVSDNVFGSSGPWPVAIGPQDAGSDERLSDVIFEKNRIHPDFGSQSVRRVQVALHTWGRYFSVRNNIIDGTKAENYFSAISVTRRGVEPAPLGIEIYNNSIFRGDANSTDHIGIIVGDSSVNTIIRNNVVSFPNVSGPKFLIRDSSTSTVSTDNLLTDTPGFLSPFNSDPLSRSFDLSTTSILVNNGNTVPVYSDFLDEDRLQDTSYSLGSYR